MSFKFQAVNSTDMWIITNGLDQGMTKIIGDAIYQEKQQRDRPMMNVAFNFADLQFTEDQTNLTVIGIVPNINISYKDQMIGKVCVYSLLSVVLRYTSKELLTMLLELLSFLQGKTGECLSYCQC